MAPILSDQVYKLTAPLKFHQRFSIPATDDHEILRVTYGFAGPSIGENVPTILMCGGMFGSRWSIIALDHLAMKMRVRVLTIDRPGFGGSTSVPLAQRLPTYLEIVPLLLAHLKIPHIHLAAQSAGTIYALNLLHASPHLLSPTKPTITVFSPWVHQSHSGVSFLRAAKLLPNSLFDNWNSLTGFVINRAVPAFGASSGVLSSFTEVFSSKEEFGSVQEREKTCKDVLGISLDDKQELEKVLVKYAFAEINTGANDEVRLCLKSLTDSCSWLACEDYPRFFHDLTQAWNEKVAKGAKALKMKVVFAEKDIMIGVKGKKYFEDCWKREEGGNGLEVEFVETMGTDHDGILDPVKGFIGEMFGIVRKDIS